jgi:tetratricopeptide (TPR) repeat protein
MFFTRYSALIIVLLFLLYSCGGTTSQTKSQPQKPTETVKKTPSAQEWFVKGNLELNNRNWRSAIHSYNEALKKDKERWEIYMNRAIAEVQSGKFEEALHSLDAALSHGGAKEPKVYFTLGNVYQERGMYDRSILAYRTGLSHGPKHQVESILNIAAAYLFLRQYSRATETYTHLRTLVPDDPRPLHGIALVLHMQKEFDEAVSVYEEVHVLDPKFPLAYLAKASVLSKTKKYEEAAQALRDFLRVAPGHRSAKRARSRLLHIESKSRADR